MIAKTFVKSPHSLLFEYQKGLKHTITNQFNFANIENPFYNTNLTLESLKV